MPTYSSRLRSSVPNETWASSIMTTLIKLPAFDLCIVDKTTSRLSFSKNLDVDSCRNTFPSPSGNFVCSPVQTLREWQGTAPDWCCPDRPMPSCLFCRVPQLLWYHRCIQLFVIRFIKKRSSIILYRSNPSLTESASPECLFSLGSPTTRSVRRSCW